MAWKRFWSDRRFDSCVWPVYLEFASRLRLLISGSVRFVNLTSPHERAWPNDGASGGLPRREV